MTNDNKRQYGTGSVAFVRGKYLARLPKTREVLGRFDTEEAAHVALDEALGAKPHTTAGEYLLVFMRDRERSKRIRDIQREWVSVNKWLLPFAISKLDLLKVTKRDVQRHLDDIRDSLSEQTTKHVRRILSQAFDEAVDEGLCASNPCRRTKVRKDERGKVATPFLMPHEIETLLNDAILSDYQRAVFTVAICTGLRQGEIFGLTRDCVHLNVQHPYIEVKRSWDQAPKNGRADQRVYLIPRAVPVLRDWLDSHDDPFVFPMPGEQMCYRRYDAGWTRVRARLGLNPNVTFHGLRKTAGTALLAGWLGPKVDPLIVSRTLRHASLKQTLDVYAFLLEGDIAEALNQETPNDSAQNHESGTKLVRLEEAEPRKYVKSWRPQRGLNPRYWRERTDDPKR